jgi:8-oxo-dGTP pyrophosphatase MutT (NUDIX family)
MMMKEYVSAGGVIIDRGRMLLLDRPRRQEIRLPKGHVDPGEARERTALREVAEESGYTDVEIVGDLGEQEVEFEHKGEQYRRTEQYYLMRLRSEQLGELSSHDAAQFQPIWLPLEEAVARLTYEPEKNVARRAIARYRELYPGT